MNESLCVGFVCVSDLGHHPGELAQEEVVQEEPHHNTPVVTVLWVNVQDVSGAQVRVNHIAHLTPTTNRIIWAMETIHPNGALE